MRYLPCNTAKKCKACSDCATSIIQNGHILKEYPICDKCKASVCFVRIDHVLHVPKIKRCGKTKRNIKIIDPKKSPVRFVSDFRQLAVEKGGELILLSPLKYHTSEATHITKDERHAVDYLLDNPPINNKGVIYQVLEGLDKYGQNELHTIFLSNSSSHHWTKTKLSLEDAYHKLISRRTSYLQKTGKRGVTTKKSKPFCFETFEATYKP